MSYEWHPSRRLSNKSHSVSMSDVILPNAMVESAQLSNQFSRPLAGAADAVNFFHGLKSG